jgi:CRP-like cAMP-binding protein
MPTRAELIERFPVLAEGMTPAELDKLLEVLEPRELAVGDALLREGEPSACAYLVWNGSFQITSGSSQVMVGPGSPSVAAGEIEGGSWLGEVSLFDGQPPTASVIAARRSLVLALPASALDGLRQSHPRLAANLTRAMCVTLAGRVRRATERLEKLREGTAGPAPVRRRGVLAALRALMGAES